MASRTRDRRVLAGQRELGRIVIEGGAQPLRGVVAGLAGLGKARRDVVRRCRLLIIRQVAGYAGRRQRRVLAVGMASRAGDRRVLAGQRELGRVVIKNRAEPLGRAVARLAGLRETRGDVVRSCRLLIIRQVAGHAGRRQRRVLAVGMASRARDRRVLAGQRELGRIVIEGGAQPLRGVVTGLAGLRESSPRRGSELSSSDNPASGTIRKLLAAWRTGRSYGMCAQATFVCLPVNGNLVVL